MRAAFLWLKNQIKKKKDAFRTLMLSGIGSASMDRSASPSRQRAPSQRSVRLSKLWGGDRQERHH